jgi:hypothetical protein
MKKATLVLVALTASLSLLVGCSVAGGGGENVAGEQQESSMGQPNVASDVSFSILNSSVIPGIKRSLDIRLPKKVSEKDLVQIAIELKAQDPRDYQRIFICYYLPGMPVDSGAWATTHFNPTLEVQILGLTAKEMQAVTTQPESAKRDHIGRWIDESPLMGGRISIFRQGGDLFIELLFKDKSTYKKELVVKNTPLGRRFDMVVKSSAGDHWVLGSDGVLQVRDSEGLIALAKPVK